MRKTGIISPSAQKFAVVLLVIYIYDIVIIIIIGFLDGILDDCFYK